MIRQFTYTASPWGKSGAGWMVFQQSRDIPQSLPKTLYPIYKFEGEQAVGDTGRSVQFAYLPSGKGDEAVLAQTTFTGMRWFDARPGDFFAHVLLLDQAALEKSTRAGINPVRLFRGAGLKSSFPDSLKKKALQIFKHEISYEPPPELPILDSLGEIAANPELSFAKTLATLSPDAVKRMGAVLYSSMLRFLGKNPEPIVFDNRNPSALAIMTLALDLLPPSWRAKTWFALNFKESALRLLPGFPSLTFYGIISKVAGDRDTGIVSGVNSAKKDPFRFSSAEDIGRFKSLLDHLGNNVSLDEDDCNNLVACWEVAQRRKTDVKSLRKAVAFAERFPGMKDEIGTGLARSLATYTHSVAINIPSDLHVLSAVAWFECGLKAFEDHAKRACSVCIQDLSLLDKVTQELKEDAACTAFVNAVVDTAKKTDTAAFTNRILESEASLERFVSGRSENDLFRLAIEYKRVFSDVQECYVIESHPIDAGLALKTVNALLSVAGSGVKDISEVRKYLEYRQEIATIRRMDEVLPTLKKYVAAGFPKGANPRKDILDHISATSVQEIVELACILDELNLQGAKLICDKWGGDKQEINRLSSKVQTLENLEPEETKKSSCLLPVMVCVMSIALGFLVGKKFGGSKMEKMSHDDYLPRRVFVEPADNQGKKEQGKDDKKSDNPVQTATNKTEKVEVKADAHDAKVN